MPNHFQIVDEKVFHRRKQINNDTPFYIVITHKLPLWNHC